MKVDIKDGMNKPPLDFLREKKRIPEYTPLGFLRRRNDERKEIRRRSE